MTVVGEGPNGTTNWTTSATNRDLLGKFASKSDDMARGVQPLA